jgi:hypothetical protein
MKKRIFEKYWFGIIFGFLFGFMVIHPFSVVFQGLFITSIHISYKSVIYAFNPQHVPMAFFFGLLGMSLGIINVYYIKAITKEQRHIKLLEGLLPICSYCKKIRDDTGKSAGEGNWERIEDYIQQKTDQEFTHGICPDCVEKVFLNKDKT